MAQDEIGKIREFLGMHGILKDGVRLHSRRKEWHRLIVKLVIRGDVPFIDCVVEHMQASGHYMRLHHPVFAEPLGVLLDKTINELTYHRK